MNLLQPNANEATQTMNRSRSVSPVSGICTRCIDGCRGNCEIFKATFRGREVIYPGPFGTLTAGADKDYPVDYSHLNVAGYALGAKGLAAGAVGNPDNTLFPMVDTETEYGVGQNAEFHGIVLDNYDFIKVSQPLFRQFKELFQVYNGKNPPAHVYYPSNERWCAR